MGVTIERFHPVTKQLFPFELIICLSTQNLSPWSDRITLASLKLYSCSHPVFMSWLQHFAVISPPLVSAPTSSVSSVIGVIKAHQDASQKLKDRGVKVAAHPAAEAITDLDLSPVEPVGVSEKSASGKGSGKEGAEEGGEGEEP